MDWIWILLWWCSFSVPHKGCGSRSQMGSKANAAGNELSFQRSLDVDVDPLFVENTIIIQHDPDFQEAGDTARRLRCVWRQSLQKSVNAKMNQIYQPVPPVQSVQTNQVTPIFTILFQICHKSKDDGKSGKINWSTIKQFGPLAIVNKIIFIFDRLLRYSGLVLLIAHR